jgi:hypothetical protein
VLFDTLVLAPGPVMARSVADVEGAKFLLARLPDLKKTDFNRAALAQVMYNVFHSGCDPHRAKGCSRVDWHEWVSSHPQWAAAWFKLADMLVQGKL